MRRGGGQQFQALQKNDMMDSSSLNSCYVVNTPNYNNLINGDYQHKYHEEQNAKID